MNEQQSQLFSMLLRLHPCERGQVSLSAGNQIQAAFLDLVRQSDPALTDRLHTPNQRRSYTLSLLQGFHHLSEREREEATAGNRMVDVHPGQVYWLRITMLDVAVFEVFVRSLITRPRDLIVRIGDARFEISRLLTTSDVSPVTSSWVAHTSFAELYHLKPATRRYDFEFASPTVFSKGQKPWGKHLSVFPEPVLVFASLARQWETFAPEVYSLTAHQLTLRTFEVWCEENIVVSHYDLHTHYLPAIKFGQVGFLGNVTYLVQGDSGAREAQWLTILARFALFCGIGYKTAMGMGQARCTNLPAACPSEATGTDGEL